MPLIIMGIIPSIIGTLPGNGLSLSFGIFFTWVATGDIISLFMLRKFEHEAMVFDHPYKMGLYIEIK